MTRDPYKELTRGVEAGWNCALNNVQNWIEYMRHEENLSKKQKTLLLELEQELKRMANVWRGRDNV